MLAKADIEFDFDSSAEAQKVLAALKPELSSAPDDRAEVSLDAKGEKLFLSISSAERAPFRAAVGTYLRWIRVVTEIGGI